MNKLQRSPKTSKWRFRWHVPAIILMLAGACAQPHGSDDDASDAGASATELLDKAAPLLSMENSAYGVGQGIGVKYASLPSGTNHWIGLYNAGGSDTSYLTWQYASGTSGTTRFSGRPAGNYEARLFLNDTYQRVASVAFRVTASTDLCPDDPNKTAPGQCGCGKLEGSCGTTTDARVRTVVHILRNFSLITSTGLTMTNDHVTAGNLNTAMMNANALWQRPELQSVAMNASIVEESALNPANAKNLKQTILATTRDNPGASFDAYWKFFDPSKRSTPQTLHIYIVPFYGQTLQGVTRLSSRAIVMGSWSNKDGGGVPDRRSVSELPANACAQSFTRTLAHEFGHALTLQHSDCNSCIMQDCTDVSPVRLKALQGWAEYWQ